jgi:hypothetical protein
MDAFDHLGSPSKTPRCSDYINCVDCATDLRVAVLPTEKDQLVVARIDTWQFFGGRDIDRESLDVQIMFGFPLFRRPGESYPRYFPPTGCYLNPPPTRNLELMYNEGVGDSDNEIPGKGYPQRIRWLRWWHWTWRYADFAHVHEYRGPD